MNELSPYNNHQKAPLQLNQQQLRACMLIAVIVVVVLILAFVIAQASWSFLGMTALKLFVVCLIIGIPSAVIGRLVYAALHTHEDYAGRRDARKRENELTGSLVRKTHVEAEVLHRTISFDHQGNAAVIHPETWQVVQVTGQMREHPGLNTLHYHNAISGPGAHVQPAPNEVLAISSGDDLPSGRDLFENGTVERYLAKDEMILGPLPQEGGKLKTIKIAHFFSALVGGIPGSGKSSTVYWIAAQLATWGARFWVVDPFLYYQSEAGQRGLAAELEDFRDNFIFDPCENEWTQIKMRVQWMLNELERRKQRGYIARPSDYVIGIIDEYNSVVDDAEDAKWLGEKLAYIEREGRKPGIHIFTIAHKFAQQDLGDVRVRSAASYVLAHRFNDQGQADHLLGKGDGKRTLTLQQGCYMLRGLLSGPLVMVQTPLLEATDMPVVRAAQQRYRAARDVVQVVEADTDPVMESVLDQVEDEAGETYRQPEKPVEMGIADEAHRSPSFEGSSVEGYRQPEKPMEPAEIGVAIFLSHAQKIKIPRILEMDAEEASQNEIIEAVWEVKPKDRAGQDAARELRRIRAYLAQQQRYLQREAQ